MQKPSSKNSLPRGSEKNRLLKRIGRLTAPNVAVNLSNPSSLTLIAKDRTIAEKAKFSGID